MLNPSVCLVWLAFPGVSKGLRTISHDGNTSVRARLHSTTQAVSSLHCFAVRSSRQRVQEYIPHVPAEMYSHPYMNNIRIVVSTQTSKSSLPWGEGPCRYILRLVEADTLNGGQAFSEILVTLLFSGVRWHVCCTRSRILLKAASVNGWPFFLNEENFPLRNVFFCLSSHSGCMPKSLTFRVHPG